ncbi:hypothetical protein N1851_003686 [Merluccius polli]|uniref:Uncharacterized protein n=1 Tax=Merluccius polli TaxID=89951 RepID=A0AA47N963_MERPO|nr:hypothetical protein N1851_003686 [Merluccius polli]
MNSKKLECTPRRHFRDRSPREWGDQDDRWNEAQGCRSNTSRDSHRTYYGEHPSEADGTKEKRQYGGSPQRAYGTEPFSHDRNRRSPARRCVTPDQGGGGGGDYARFRYSSPETCTSQEHRVAERRKSLTGDAEDYFKHRRLDSDFRSWPPTKENIDYDKRPEHSKRRPTSEDFAYRHPSEYAMERQTQDRNVACGTKPLPESSSRTEHNSTNHSPALSKSVTEQATRSDGFQRFLSVLNKGVDVNMLTKIVTQAPTGPDPRHTAEPPGSHRATGKEDKHQHTVYWNQNNEPQQPQGEQQSKSILSNDKAENHINTSTRLTPTQAVVKVKVTPEEEQKCKEMQHLFQTIGMDLGLEELGKMSNRIQQRLYGNKEDRERRDSEKETRRETRQIFSPGGNSRSSSSSRSSFGPPVTQHIPLKKDLLGAPATISETDQGAGIGNKTSGRNYDGDRTCQDSSPALQSIFAPNTTYSLAQAPTSISLGICHILAFQHFLTSNQREL